MSDQKVETTQEVFKEVHEALATETTVEAPVVVDKAIEEAVTEPSIEDIARSKGWRPKDEFKDSADYVDAKEFLAREPIFNQIKDLKKQLSSVVGYNQRIEKKIAEAELRGYQNAIAELEAQKQLAQDSYDTDLVKRIDNQITKQQDNLQKAQQSNIPQEAIAFVNKHRNTFVQNPALYQVAVHEENLIRLRNPGLSDGEIFEKLENSLAKDLGIEVKKPEPTVRVEATKPKLNPVAPVSRTTVTDKGEDNFSIHDLSDNAKTIYKGIERINREMGIKFSVKDFLEQAKSTGTYNEMLK